MRTNFKEKLRGKAVSALMNDAHAHCRHGHFKTSNMMVNQSGLLEDAEKDLPRFLAMTRDDLLQYIRERDLRTKEYRETQKANRKKI